MTGMLSSVLREHADALHSPELDLDAMVRTGDRRVRRRRVGAGLAAASVAVIAASTLALPRIGTDGADLTAGPSSLFEERSVGYAVGDVIHWGDRSFTMGATVASYVQTDDGFVYTTPKEEAWLFDGATSERIGDVRGGRLEADTDGSLVAWTDSTGEPEYVVFDTAARREVARVPAPAEAEVFAVDGRSVYWSTAESIVRYDVATGSTAELHRRRVVDPAAKGPTFTGLLDVASGRLAYTVDALEWGIRVGREIDLEARPLAQATHGALSPDGRYLAAEEHDYISVYDTASGEDVTPDVARYPFAVAYAWVDQDTAMVFALEEVGGGPSHMADFLACDVPTGDCTVVGSDRVTERLVLPIGMPAT